MPFRRRYAGNLVENEQFRKKLDACQSKLDEGMDLSEAFKEADIFTGVYAKMASIAGKAGVMDEVMSQIAAEYEDDVDNQEEELREKHIERLSAGRCEPSAGVVFLDILSNLERISDHAYNIAGYVKDEL